MTISVVIPIYNVGKYLNACLKSCVGQTYGALEIICVNDGSSDDSESIIDAFAAADSRIRKINKANGGLPSARRAGIDAATGDYIFHLDGDDDMPLDAIERLAEVAAEDGADIVIGDYYSIDSEEGSVYRDSRVRSVMSGYEYVRFILTEGLFNIWGKLIKRSLYTENQVQIPLDISMGEDLVQMMQLAFYAQSVSFCKSPVYNYYIRPTSMSLIRKNTVGELTDRSIYAVDFITAFLRSCCDGPTKALLSEYVMRFIYEYMRSRYPVGIRKTELERLCGFIDGCGVKKNSFRNIVCRIATKNLVVAKALVRLSNIVRR